MSRTVEGISIRTAAERDAADLARLSGELGYPSDTATIAGRLALVRRSCAGEIYVAVDRQSTIVGWTHVAPRLNLEEQPFAELAGLIVGNGARGLGVGTLLLRAAEHWAREHGYAKLRVRSNVVRERAHRFYLREGYVERKRQVVFDKPL
jgi:GNAT superfamily N-acetyltransferase